VRSYYLQREIEMAQDGDRNNTIYWAACRFGEMVREGKISREVAEGLLLSSCRILFREPVWPEVRETIRYGLDRPATD
jgi:hypothetical protein